MKYILSIAFVFVLGFTLQAQNTLLYQPGLDTITNTGSDTILFTPPAKNYDYAVDVSIVESISGTDSLNVTLQESIDNTYWWNAANAVTVGSSTATNKVTGTLYGKYHRLIVTGVGTQSTSYQSNLFYRRKD